MKFILSFFLVLFVQTVFGQKKSFNKDSLVAVLEKVYKDDQEPRLMFDSIEAKYGFNSPETKTQIEVMAKNDAQNVKIVEAVIERYGWIGIEESSENANRALFFVIQHADLKIQLKYFPVIENAVKSKKASAKWFAMLVDRTNIDQGKFQIYGSQLQGPNNQNLKFLPISDEPNVNKRRKEIGLEPMEEYAKRWNLIYTLPSKDRYKNKIVFEGYIKNTKGQPLEDAEIFLGDNKFLGKTDKLGTFSLILDKHYLGWAFIFRKNGYQTASWTMEGVSLEYVTNSQILNNQIK